MKTYHAEIAFNPKVASLYGSASTARLLALKKILEKALASKPSAEKAAK